MNTSTKKTENLAECGNKSKLLIAIVLIFCRFSLAFLLGMLPFTFGLKSDWYVIPLIVFGFIFQFGLATFQMIPYFKQIVKYQLASSPSPTNFDEA